jgi:glycosyltransferase involved in cell wall biosynthesis
MGREVFYITTPIFYANDLPHIGHGYVGVATDFIARYHRLKGEPTFFLTGVDQHGQKVQQAAQMQGVVPQDFVDGITEKFRALWKKLEIDYTGWAATTDARHKECVRKILTRLNNEGQIYKDKRGGYYSVRQEQFLTDKERGPDGQYGPEWGEVVQLREEFAAASVYVQASQHETFCLAVLEAMSAGLPVVVTQSTGMSYLLKDGANGYVVSFGDSKMLAERLKTLLDDEALRSRIGQTNIARAREINWDASAKLLAGCFQSLCRGNDGRGTESSPLLAASKTKELQS